MRKLKLGIIGAGKTARWHLKAYKGIPGVEIVAIANPFSERGKRLAKKYKARHFTSGFDLIEQADIDIIDICVPTGLHRDFIKRALIRGFHVYTEKPICASVEEIEEIIAINKNANRIIFNGFNYRFLSEFCKIRSVIQSGQLGDVRYLRVMRMTKGSPDSYMFGPYSCGLFNEFHCHFVDLMFSFGFGKPDKVFASGTSVYNHKNGPDTATIVLFYPNKMIVEITTSIASPGLSPELLIIGTKGTLRLNYGRVFILEKRDVWALPHLIILMFRESIVIPFRILKNPFKGSCRHFINCVVAEKRSECDEWSALKTFKITTAATESYYKKEAVSLT